MRVRNSLWGATFPPCTSLSIYPTQLAWRPDQTQPVSLARESAYAAERELRPAICGTCAVCFLKKMKQPTYSVKSALRLEEKDLPARLMSRWLSMRLRSSTCLRHMFFHFLKANLRENGQTISIPTGILLLL